MNPTLYDILGVPPEADRDEIKRAWRDAADRFEPGSGGSSQQFRLFNEAAEVLLDPQRRKEYDTQLGVALPEPVQAPAPGSASTTSEMPPRPQQESEIRRRGVPLAVLAVLGLLAAVAVGVAAYLGFQAQRVEGYEQAVDQAPAAAERAAVAVLSYDFESLDADRDAAAKFLTESYADDYTETFDSLVKKGAEQTSAKVEAEVLASSAMLQTGESRDPDRVRVLLFLNQTTLSTANSGEPQVALNRVRFDMVKVDGTWLVDDITSY